MAGGDHEIAAGPPVENWRNHPFVSGLTEEQLAILARCALPVRYEAGQSIFHEGEPANRFYLILHGGVALQSRTSAEGVTLVATLAGGDVLGWSWMFPPFKWHFDAVAVEATQTVFFYGTWLRQMAEVHPEFGYELMKRLADLLIQRLQATRRQWLAGPEPSTMSNDDPRLRMRRLRD